MERPEKQRLSDLLRQDLLPPPPLGRPLASGGAAALLGAIAWGAIAYESQVEFSYLAWAIGGVIGFAIVKAGGYGTQLAAAGAVLAILSIGTGKHLAFRLDGDRWAEQALTPELHAELEADAVAWGELDRSDDAKVEQFARDRGYEFESPVEFRAVAGTTLDWFRTERPSLQDWRDWQTAQLSFVDHLKDDFHPFDVVFAVLGLATAAGIVGRRTGELRAEAFQQARAERDAAREALRGEGAANS